LSDFCFVSVADAFVLVADLSMEVEVEIGGTVATLTPDFSLMQPAVTSPQKRIMK
jgi:hypothetical protein